MNKNLLIEINDKSTKLELDLFDLVEKYNETEMKLKQHETKLKELKEELKKYDFEKATFNFVQNGRANVITLEIKQWVSNRKSLNEETLISLLKDKIPKIADLIECAKETKEVKNIRFIVKKD